jgi:opine dehydrogenase
MTRRRLSILGAGAIGIGTAALAASRGHDVTLCSRNKDLAFDGNCVEVTGALAGRYPVRVVTEVAQAVRDTDLVLVAAPANAHRLFFEGIAANVRESQTVLISGMLSFGALVLERLMSRHGTRALVAGMSTTPLTGRTSGTMRATVSTLRKRVGLAAIPASRTGEAIALAEDLWGNRFAPEPDVVAITLGNVNPVAHLGLVIANFTRIERGEAWPQYLHLTHAVARLIEALDRERIALSRSFGHEPIDVATHLALSFGQSSSSLATIAERLHALRGGPPGPVALDTRFITEDGPYGIWPTIALARAVDRPVPLHESGLAVLSALCGQDFRRMNDLLSDEDLVGGIAAVLTRAREGRTR